MRLRCGYGVAGGCYADVMLHSSDNYHQKDALEPRWLPKEVAAAWSAVMFRFHRVSILYK